AAVGDRVHVDLHTDRAIGYRPPPRGERFRQGHINRFRLNHHPIRTPPGSMIPPWLARVNLRRGGVAPAAPPRHEPCRDGRAQTTMEPPAGSGGRRTWTTSTHSVPAASTAKTFRCRVSAARCCWS